MKTLSKPLLLCFAVLFATAVLSAQTKSNFNGTWLLNVEKSELGGAPITKMVVQVEHEDPVFRYTAKGTSGGQDFEETESLTTDGKPGRDAQGAAVKTHWEGATLVSEAIGGDGNPLYEARLTLSEDGKTVTRDFIRKSADDPQKRHEIYEKK
jgi:hypothetical protein